MSRYRGEQPGKRRSWPLLGLLLVAFILGHDALMALEALAAPHEAAAASHHAAQLPASEDGAPAPHGSAPEPKHPDNCSIGLSALLRSGDDVAGVDQALPVDRVTAPSASSAGFSAAFAWEEPRWPPGRQRALFQVYRI